VIKGVLLDVDGTLVLSNDAHARSWVEALAACGHTVRLEDVRPLIGMGSDKLLPALIPGIASDSAESEKMSDLHQKIFLEKYALHLRPAPGSRDLVGLLRDSGLKLVVASSASQASLQTLLRAAQVEDLLRQATTADDANNSKPDPDIVHAAFEKIRLPAAEVLMIGDTPYDVEAAGKAGVQLVAVRCGGWDDHRLEGAIAIYDDPADIYNHYKSSPFMD
jgi:HAD superfamily hydrolase (TIGR01509 family)